MPYHYTTGGRWEILRNIVINFEFVRLRFHFRALDPLHFPPGKSGNVIRGALGKVLRDTGSPEAYARLFEPGNALGRSPSGLVDWPRPFVLRASHLSGHSIPRDGAFYFDVHVFDLRAPVPAYFRDAFARFGAQGIGPGHGRAVMERAESIDLEDRAGTPPTQCPLAINLEPGPEPTQSVRVRFLTPTEVKSNGKLAKRPEFAILFARLRDRISTLRALYGAGPLEIDFRAMGERAEHIQLGCCSLQWEKVERKSGRTGQFHPLGGFTGEAEYNGDLREFLPWLHAARWVGVGRQTVWGKGDVRIVSVR